MAKAKKQVSFEDALWGACDKLRGTVEPAEYKHVVLGLIFLKFVNDKFDARRAELIAEGKENDIMGRVYEYFLTKFVLQEDKGKGEFYTPKSVVNLIAKMIEPYKGKIYDPCCGSGGMFVQSLKFVENHAGSSKDVSVYGQEGTTTTYKLAKMNLAIRSIPCDLGEKAADTFTNDLHKDLRQMGSPFEKKYIELTQDDRNKATQTFHAWQQAGKDEAYKDIPEFCYSATKKEIAKKGYNLVPSRYIEFVNRDETIDFDTSMKNLQKELGALFRLEEMSKKELLGVFKEMGYEIKL